MCAEKLFFRCHRRLISDCLAAQGVEVVHLYDEKRSQKHAISQFARVRPDGNIIYPGPDPDAPSLF